MKLRALALAGTALLALSAPAAASDNQGWYLGLGIGWDTSELVHMTPNGGPETKVPFHDDVLGTATVGYKFGDFRAELEGGYDERAMKKTSTIAGGMSVTSGLFNLIYDVPVTDRFSVSIGGGAGFGSVNPHIKDSPLNAYFVRGSNTGFMWQGIAGVSYALDDGVDLSLDWRYRSAEVDHGFHSDFPAFNPVHITAVHENVALLSMRWYLDRPEAAPPPPPMQAAPPPPPPPQIAPMVKTFIVFFDFDKSNLTEKAQQVVSEAVKAAKTSGMVKVVVTGHTDTVGSDTYNQALSERRAQSVKDEMVRQGMDEATIGIEGKSFHDPLVATGPGVREPQNCRAVIDLGG